MLKIKKLTSLLVAAALILSCGFAAMAAEAPTAFVPKKTTLTLDEVYSEANADGTVELSYNQTATYYRQLNMGDSTATKSKLYFKADISEFDNATSAQLLLSVPKINNGATLYVKKVTNWGATFGSVALTAGETTTVTASEVTLPTTGDTLASAKYEYMGTVSNPVGNKTIDMSKAVADAIKDGEDTLAFVLEYSTLRTDIDSFRVYGYGKGAQAPKLEVVNRVGITAKANFVEEKTVKISATQANSGATDKANPTENVLAVGTWEKGMNELIVNSSSDKRIFYQFDLSPYIGKIQKAELKVMFNTKKWDLAAVSEATTEVWAADTICYDTMPKTSGNVVSCGYGTSTGDKWLSFDHTDYVKSMNSTDAMFGATVYAKPGDEYESTTSIAKVYGVNHSGYNPYLEITYLEEATAFNAEGMIISGSVNADFGTARPIVALFNGETFVDAIIYDEIDLSVSNSFTQTITAEKLVGATSAKLFLWESIGTLMPLCTSDEL